MVFCPIFTFFSQNISSYIYQEAANNQEMRVELKLVQSMEMLPEKFSYLRGGSEGYYVELINEEEEAKSQLVDEKGKVIFENLKSGEYRVVVAKAREFSPAELRRNKEYMESLFVQEDYLNTSIDKLSVTGDIFAVIVIRP
ncbi:MAG: hypothetical protein KatS3mg087_0836 [Patescibacteria group bacterium]|nr:MAG: hypothetical protein KatS3mg087_0836 [Patescibacteria group bacterium]